MAAPEETVKKDAPPEDEWTVIIYLAGDNNLTDASVYAMTEMRKVGSGNGVNILTQFDPKDPYLPTHRYRITRQEAGDGPRLAEDIIDTSSGSGAFRNESPIAMGHENVRSRARAEGMEASVREAHRLALATARSMAGGAQEPVRVRETVLLDSKDEPSIAPNETDTGSPVTLYNFMSRCVQLFPAKHYMVVLAGHGSGPRRDFLLRDDSPAGSLTMNELKGAFKELASELGEGQKIDILGMDTCLMSMAEVAYELRDHVKILVASESYSPVSGWPYEPILNALKEGVATLDEQEEAARDAEQKFEYRFARDIVERYVNFYADYALGGLSVDQAALNVGAADELKGRIDAFAEAMRSALKAELEASDTRLKDDLVLAHWEAQSYNGEQYVDVFDFCDCLLKRQKAGDIFETGSALMNFISNTFVLKSCYSGPTYQYSYGVSIYFPWARIEDDYSELDFIDDSMDSGWGGFLTDYTKLTRRDPRPVPDAPLALLRKANITLRPVRQTEGRGGDGQNPVSSMRNPPIYAEPEECIKRREVLQMGMRKVHGLQ